MSWHGGKPAGVALSETKFAKRRPANVTFETKWKILRPKTPFHLAFGLPWRIQVGSLEEYGT